MDGMTTYTCPPRSGGQITTTLTMPVQVFTWTWAEAIEVANRAENRARVSKQGDRWVIRWNARPVAMNMEYADPEEVREAAAAVASRWSGLLARLDD